MRRMAATVMKISRNGQISLPAAVRHRWNVDRVIVIDTPGGLMVRPFDPDAVDRIRGKYHRPGAPSVDEVKAAERRIEARKERR